MQSRRLLPNSRSRIGRDEDHVAKVWPRGCGNKSSRIREGFPHQRCRGLVILCPKHPRGLQHTSFVRVHLFLSVVEAAPSDSKSSYKASRARNLGPLRLDNCQKQMHAHEGCVLKAPGMFRVWNDEPSASLMGETLADAARFVATPTWPYLCAAVFISTDAGAAFWAETARLHRLWAGVAFATSDLASSSVIAAIFLPPQMWRMGYDVTVGLVWPYLAKLGNITIFAIYRSLVVLGSLTAVIASVFLGKKLWTYMASSNVFCVAPQVCDIFINISA